MKAKLIKTGESFLLKDVNNETLAITSGTMQGRMLSLENCQAIERGYDLDVLAEEFAKNHSIYPTAQDDTEYGFKHGFQKALELMGDKKFSEEDIIKIAEYVRVASQSSPSVRTKYLLDEYQSLQQHEWDVEIEMEYHPTFQIVKLDANGCLILKRI